ncbi:DUF4160 domain-containing protein [Thiorhodovibrio frisius]|uniref:DUF4160 domain-containing protein n=1 Tax=Thiorhodovibrio frisius TaxID=631362 RepID=H8YY68_9GAMM|nr:DUF4160 domain-containing protein [Thiorhodovibrio frisius]EIC23394.1 hypothetical protein Thi970DRAFT_01058 [Thiorhodovibrio frisius]WPL23523.1 hypothetical protein Thiofri_03713 [Thiorhodovibrio frisius]
MTTKERFRDKYRLELRERDHGPAHVHLVGGEIDVIIYLDSLLSEGTWPKGLRQEVLNWIEQHRTQLMEDWKQWHP